MRIRRRESMGCVVDKTSSSIKMCTARNSVGARPMRFLLRHMPKPCLESTLIPVQPVLDLAPLFKVAPTPTNRLPQSFSCSSRSSFSSSLCLSSTMQTPAFVRLWARLGRARLKVAKGSALSKRTTTRHETKATTAPRTARLVYRLPKRLGDLLTRANISHDSSS